MSRLTETAAAFVSSIAKGEHILAHEFLSPALARAVSPEELADEFHLLAGDMDGVTNIGEPIVILDDWPSKAPNDLAVVYVPLEGDVYSEAITITLSELDGKLFVTDIEWGRP